MPLPMPAVRNVIPDGQGFVWETAEYWWSVEDAVRDINSAADDTRELWAAALQLDRATDAYRARTGTLTQLAEKQAELLRLAAMLPAFDAKFVLLESALAEYHRIGGAPDRAPDAGIPSGVFA